MTDLERQFETAMQSIYTRAKAEAGYTATRFLQMLSSSGGLTTAKTLLHSPTVSEGYSALWQRGRLDLTVEALVLDPKWSELFTEDEITIARTRLEEFGFFS